MSMTNNPPQWYKIYKGNDEAKFFRSLNRVAKYKWRSTSALAAETGLSKVRVEEIVLKYLYDGKNPLGMVMQSPSNEDHWGYWERVPELIQKIPDSISDADKKIRIDKAMGCEITLNDLAAGATLDIGYTEDKVDWIEIKGVEDVNFAIEKSKSKQYIRDCRKRDNCHMSPGQAMEYLQNLESG